MLFCIKGRPYLDIDRQLWSFLNLLELPVLNELLTDCARELDCPCFCLDGDLEKLAAKAALA